MTDPASFRAGAEAKRAWLFTASMFCRHCWSRRSRYRKVLLPAFRLCAMHDWGIPRGETLTPAEEFQIRQLLILREERK